MIPYLLESHKFNLPECWEEVTTRQWFQLQEVDLKDDCAILAILSGVPREVWFNTDKIDIVEKMLPILNFMNNPLSLVRYPVPAKIKVGAREIEISKDIRLKTFGAKLTYQNELYSKDGQGKYIYLNDDHTFKSEFVPVGLSIYLCEEPFSDAKAKELIDDILNVPIAEAYPTAAFFLNNFLESL